MSFEALRNLKQLFEEGFIDDEEYMVRKTQIIDHLTQTTLEFGEGEKLDSPEDGLKVSVKREEDQAATPIENGSPTKEGRPRRERKIKVRYSDDDTDEEFARQEELHAGMKRRYMSPSMLNMSLSNSNNTETYTWSELIEKALITLGGSRSGSEITDFIEDNYRHILENKTKTWKNSVFGCLSSNARKRWIKETKVISGKKRYVWRLNNGDEILNPDGTVANVGMIGQPQQLQLMNPHYGAMAGMMVGLLPSGQLTKEQLQGLAQHLQQQQFQQQQSQSQQQNGQEDGSPTAPSAVTTVLNTAPAVPAQGDLGSPLAAKALSNMKGVPKKGLTLSPNSQTTSENEVNSSNK